MGDLLQPWEPMHRSTPLWCLLPIVAVVVPADATRRQYTRIIFSWLYLLRVACGSRFFCGFRAAMCVTLPPKGGCARTAYSLKRYCVRCCTHRTQCTFDAVMLGHCFRFTCAASLISSTAVGHALDTSSGKFFRCTLIRRKWQYEHTAADSPTLWHTSILQCGPTCNLEAASCNSVRTRRLCSLRLPH